MVEAVVTAAQRDQVRVGVIATVLAMDDVMHVEVVPRATSGDAALVRIPREDAAALSRRDRVTGAGVRVVDVAHDRRVARQRRELRVVELRTVGECVAVGRDPDLRGAAFARRRMGGARRGRGARIGSRARDRSAIGGRARDRSAIAESVDLVVVVDEAVTALGLELLEHREEARRRRWLDVEADESTALVGSRRIRGAIAADVARHGALDLAVGHAARVVNPLFFGLG
ncbi:MAG: hypothetical protein AB7L94_38150, partial [Kofleriaceae bacterium]